MRRLLPLTRPALLIFFAVAGCTSSGPEQQGFAFYAEFATSVETDPDPNDPFPPQQVSPANSTLRWWYSEGVDAVSRWRWEIEDTDPTIDAGTRTTVFDGDYQWVYDDRPLRYERQRPFPAFENHIPGPLFGPSVGPTNAPDIDAFIALWRTGDREQGVKRVGEEVLLGRRTEIIEIRPAWTGSTSVGSAAQNGQPSQSQQTSTSGGIIRASIDPERMFVMRWVIDEGPGRETVTSTVTRLDYNQPIDESKLTFDPPPAAREVEPSSTCVTSVTASIGLGAPGAGLLSASKPRRFDSGASSVQGGIGCGSYGGQTIVRDGDDSYILLRQRIRPGGIPAVLRTGEQVDLHGSTAYLSDVGGITRLIWFQDGIVAELTASELPGDDLRIIAESARITPSDDGR